MTSTHLCPSIAHVIASRKLFRFSSHACLKFHPVRESRQSFLPPTLCPLGIFPAESIRRSVLMEKGTNLLIPRASTASCSGCCVVVESIPVVSSLPRTELRRPMSVNFFYSSLGEIPDSPTARAMVRELRAKCRDQFGSVIAWAMAEILVPELAKIGA